MDDRGANVIDFMAVLRERLAVAKRNRDAPHFLGALNANWLLLDDEARLLAAYRSLPASGRDGRAALLRNVEAKAKRTQFSGVDNYVVFTEDEI